MSGQISPSISLHMMDFYKGLFDPIVIGFRPAITPPFPTAFNQAL